jgi:hypothetical protein
VERKTLAKCFCSISVHRSLVSYFSRISVYTSREKSGVKMSSKLNRSYLKLRMSLKLSKNLLEELKNSGVDVGTAARHVRNAQKAVEKMGRTKMPNTEVSE